MKAVLAIVGGALAAGFALLLLLLALERLWGGWPAAAVLIGLALFPAFWVIGGLGFARAAEARQRGASPWLGVVGHACPRCGRAPMPLSRKWTLRRGDTARCRHCGLLLTQDSLPAMLFLAPLLAALLMAPLLGAVVRGISAWHTIAWLLAAGGVVSLFMALTCRLLPCEPLGPP